LEIEMKRIPSTPVVRVRSVEPPERVDAFLDEAYLELFPYLEDVSATPSGPPFVVYGDLTEEGVRVELCVPTERVLHDRDNIAAAVLPGGEFASATHFGRREELIYAFLDMVVLLREKGYRFTGSYREIQIASLETIEEDPEYMTELQFQVERAA
jgi:effector-binding domain-containing protein